MANTPHIHTSSHNTTGLIHFPSSLTLTYTNQPDFASHPEQLTHRLHACGLQPNTLYAVYAFDHPISLQDLGQLWQAIEHSRMTRIMIPIDWPMLEEAQKILTFFHRQNSARHSIVLFSDSQPIHHRHSPINLLLGSTLAKTQRIAKTGVFTHHLEQLNQQLDDRFKQLRIQALCLGGTLDKDPCLAPLYVGEPCIQQILIDHQCSYQLDVHSICKKDSQHLTNEDIENLFIAIQMVQPDQPILITCGTDQMARIARTVQDGFPNLPNTLIFTGAMTPYSMVDPKRYDAAFNIGYALENCLHLDNGVYIAMNGQIFQPNNTRKVTDTQSFETT